MKLSCDVIKDILPLYAEDMVSNATKEVVEEHISVCADCTRELESLNQARKLPVEANVSSLKRVGDSIRRRRILSVMAVLLFVATVLIGGALMLDAKIYLSAGEAVQDIYVDGDTVKIVWNDQIIGTSSAMNMENIDNYAVTAWTSLYKQIFPKERVPYEALSDDVKAMVTEEQYAMLDNISTYSLADGMNRTNFWYRDPGNSSMTLILNADRPFPEKPLMDVYPYTGYYCAGLAFLAILCFLFAMVNKNRWYGELAIRLSIVLISLSVSGVIVTAGQFMGLEGDFQIMLFESTVDAVPMGLFGLCVRQIVKLNRQDKGL